MEEEVGKTFARRVREEMKRSNYSQKQICELCNLKESAFSRYLTTGRIPRPDILANIANVLKTTSDSLLGKDQNGYGFDTIKSILTCSRENLTTGQIKELIGVLKDEFNME